MLLKPFKPDGAVMTIVNLALELEKYKRENAQLKADKKCLSELIQKRIPFETRA